MMPTLVPPERSAGSPAPLGHGLYRGIVVYHRLGFFASKARYRAERCSDSATVRAAIPPAMKVTAPRAV